MAKCPRCGLEKPDTFEWCDCGHNFEIEKRPFFEASRGGREPPRFPLVAAGLCAACLGAAAWLWMRYSYCWDVTPRRLCDERPIVGLGSWEGMFVRCRTRFGPEIGGGPRGVQLFFSPDDMTVFGIVPHADEVVPAGKEYTFSGRVALFPLGNTEIEVVDTTQGRLIGASIAGLVVGAMGVFVFAAAFLHWRKRRRFHGEQDAEVVSRASPAQNASRGTVGCGKMPSERNGP